MQKWVSLDIYDMLVPQRQRKTPVINYCIQGTAHKQSVLSLKDFAVSVSTTLQLSFHEGLHDFVKNASTTVSDDTIYAFATTLRDS